MFLSDQLRYEDEMNNCEISGECIYEMIFTSQYFVCVVSKFVSISLLAKCCCVFCCVVPKVLCNCPLDSKLAGAI